MHRNDNEYQNSGKQVTDNDPQVIEANEMSSATVINKDGLWYSKGTQVNLIQSLVEIANQNMQRCRLVVSIRKSTKK